MASIVSQFCSKEASYMESVKLLDYNVVFSEYIDKVSEDWNRISFDQDIFFSVPFLKNIEDYPPHGIKPFYVIIKHGDAPVGCVYIQYKHFYFDEGLRDNKQYSNFKDKVKSTFKKLLISKIKLRTLVIGNLLLTGQYGFFFKNLNSKEDQWALLRLVENKVKEKLLDKGIDVELTLFKDFSYNDEDINIDQINNLTRLVVQPRMVLDIDPRWNNFNDYLDAMKSKYRVRARKAASLIKDFVLLEMELVTIVAHEKKMHELYKSISDNAGFNTFILHNQYFSGLKAALGDNFKVFGYFEEDNLVGFYTIIKNTKGIMNAHFLGYDVNFNRTHQLYQNILLNIVNFSIYSKAIQVDLSRTAIEIKSTVGARPQVYHLYLSHKKQLINSVLNNIAEWIKPDQNYVIRNPFRDEHYPNG